MFETTGFEPISGILKYTPEDFFVEEIPAYPPSGTGEHFYLIVEKIGLNTLDLLHKMSRLLGVPSENFGYAGLKDKMARTRQIISVFGIHEDQLKQLENQDHFQILEWARHQNKIRIGHLRGNRFTLKIRETRLEDEERARKMLEHLEKYGMPNFYGEQRFGHQEMNDKLGKLILQKSEGKETRSLPRKMRQFYLSAYQSYLFNEYLKAHFSTRHQLVLGEVVMKHPNGACFLVESLQEQSRYDRREISSTGPIFGYQMLRPYGELLELENRLLADEKISLTDFKLGGGLSQKGDRRALRVIPKEIIVQKEPDGLLLKFSLPKGAYATTLFAQLLQKN